MKYLSIILIITLALCACASSENAEKEEFIVNLKSPQISMGQIDVQFDNTFPIPGIRKLPLTLSYFPQEDAVCLQYRVDMITYYQFWSRSGRWAFVNALAQYKDDYEARSLNRRGGNRAKREYGIVDGYLIWQTFSFSVQPKASVKTEVGYIFKNNFPYFLLNQLSAYYVDPDSNNKNRSTAQIPMYFTRAQAEELAVLFDQEYLQGLRLSEPGAAVNEIDIQTDEY